MYGPGRGDDVEVSLGQLHAVVQRLDVASSGRLGVAAVLLGTDEVLNWRHDEQFRTASTVKVAVHAAVMAEAAQGRLDLDSRVRLRREDLAGGSGVLNVVRPGLEPTVADLCTLMIVVSDNTATNMLIDLLGGTEQVNRVISRLGFGQIVLHRRLEYPPPPLVAGPHPPEAPPAVSFATATPASLCRLVGSIWAGQVVDGDASRLMLATLAHQQSQGGVPRAFLALAEPGQPPGPWPSIANKTGAVPGCRADIGVMGLPGDRYIAYAVMADDLTDPTMTWLSEGDELLGHVGAALLRHWWPGPTDVPVRPGWPGVSSLGRPGPGGGRASG